MIERPSSKWPNCQVSWTYGHNERPGWRRSPPKPTWVRWEDHPEWKIPWVRTNKPLVANHLLSLAETTVSGTRLKKQGTSLHLFNFLHYFASLSSLKVQAASLIRFAGPIPGSLGSSLQKLSPGAGRVWPFLLDSMMHMTYIPSIGDSRLRRSLKSQNAPTF